VWVVAWGILSVWFVGMVVFGVVLILLLWVFFSFVLWGGGFDGGVFG